jgi:hypothetical protein
MNSDLVTAWIEELGAWVHQNEIVLELVYGWVLENDEWPEVEKFDQWLWQQGHRKIRSAQILETRPVAPGRPRHPHPDAFRLTVRELNMMDSAQPLVSLVVRATKLAIEVYEVPGRELQVRASDMRRSALPQRQQDVFTRLPRILSVDHPTPFSGFNFSEDWILGVNPGSVRDFAEVESIEDYLKVQEDYERRFVSAIAAASAPYDTAPRRTFVVMPFLEPWSNDVFDLIQRCVSAVDESIEVVRADRIPKPGRITMQIMEEITRASFIVADVTNTNPNVFWELGFAHALHKPTILLTQAVEDAPFDVHDHRMVLYNPETIDLVEEELTAHVVNALEMRQYSEIGETSTGPLWS